MAHDATQFQTPSLSFLPTITRHSIWLYARFTLSLRDIEQMLAERGVDLSYETIRRWF